ncbi:HPr family phosphocarrier protein [Cellulosilyticum sp. I15G10I2]|uniref:HPr family phosphocarrier protein n=1 Tax=Cellulosilyticum sp. I15G10I2 TaxID=1892843 RepID=UPI00085C5BDA|nr:HPr family phosphocarrier protein [Cellulosilyticum sp. I15G10I2]
MEQVVITVKNETGIHARPASQLVKKAVTFSSTIKIEKEGQTADAKRILNVMALNVKQGETIKLIVEGADEKEAALAMKEIIEAF